MSGSELSETKAARTVPGRHRRSAATLAWTPAVDPVDDHGRHRVGSTPPPLREQPSKLSDAEEPEVPAQRTKVTLAPAAEETEDVRVYFAPEEPESGGLSTFDLGNIPASVTPPRSWRRAAWFAAAASVVVVVGLLVAGRLVFGASPYQADNGDRWTGFQGNPPDVALTSDSAGKRTTAATATTGEQSGSNVPVGGPQQPATTTSQRGEQPPADGSSGQPTTTSPKPPTTTQVPQKPKPVPATRESDRRAIYILPSPADRMGDRSETFLNEITENPEIAHEQTGGNLYAQGAQGIARSYADIAYFEVQHIYISERDGKTVNTVNVVYNDGTERQEQCVLKFEDKDKIVDDCR